MENVPLLIDTGADATALPLAYVEKLGVEPDQNRFYEVVGFDGRPRIVNMVEMEIEFLDYKTRLFYPPHCIKNTSQPSIIESFNSFYKSSQIKIAEAIPARTMGVVNSVGKKFKELTITLTPNRNRNNPKAMAK